MQCMALQCAMIYTVHCCRKVASPSMHCRVESSLRGRSSRQNANLSSSSSSSSSSPSFSSSTHHHQHFDKKHHSQQFTTLQANQEDYNSTTIFGGTSESEFWHCAFDTQSSTLGEKTGPRFMTFAAFYKNLPLIGTEQGILLPNI